MNPAEIFQRTLHGLAATAFGVLARVRGRRSDRQLHVERLAAEIVEVARSIEADLQDLPRTSDNVALTRRCGECRARAQHAASRGRLRDDALEAVIGQLHDDHRRVVDLRSEADILMTAKRSGQPASRIVRFAPSSKPRFATTGLLTRPSTLG